MSFSIYSLAPVTINSTTLACDNFALPHGIAATLHQHSGNEFPTLAATSGARPSITFSTPFANAYTLFGLSALQITTLNVYLAKFVNLIRGGTLSHPLLALATSATAYGHITGWSCNQDGILMAQVEIFYLSSDGATHPIAAVQTGQSLPALSAQPTLHTLGPVTVNGTTVSGASAHSCQMNQQCQVSSATDGDLYPRVAARTGAQPKLAGDHLDPIALNTALGYQGANVSSNVVQYFRSYNATTGLNSTANSVSITVASGRIHPLNLGVAQSQIAKLPYEVLCLSTSSTNPLAVSLTATAPAPP